MTGLTALTTAQTRVLYLLETGQLRLGELVITITITVIMFGVNNGGDNGSTGLQAVQELR